MNNISASIIKRVSCVGVLGLFLLGGCSAGNSENDQQTPSNLSGKGAGRLEKGKRVKKEGASESNTTSPVKSIPASEDVPDTVSIPTAPPATTHTEPVLLAPNAFETTYENQADTYRNLEKIATTRRIAGVTHGRTFRQHPDAHKLATLQPMIDTYIAAHRCSGVLVLLNGETMIEAYGMGSTAESKWHAFSMTKSILATMVGAAIKDGHLTLATRVRDVLGEKAGPIYGDVTVERLLRMQSGVQVDGDEIGAFLAIAQKKERGAGLQYLAGRGADIGLSDGKTFQYNNGDSHVLAEVLNAVVRRAGHKGLSEYLSDKIVRPFQMEGGSWMSETTEDGELGAAGISLSLRDYARFAQGLLEDIGKGDAGILPVDWHKAAYVKPGAAVSRHRDGSAAGYGYQWWSDSDNADASDFAFIAGGMMGQKIAIYPNYGGLVVVRLSAWPPGDDAAGMRAENDFEAVRQVLTAAYFAS